MSDVLIAEDDADIRELLELLLTDAGHRTRTVDNGSAAVDACRSAVPDIVVLDVAMPGEVDGLEVCRRLRGELDAGDVPVLLITARARQSDVDAGMAAGADDYLVKPFTARDLLGRVDALLER